MPASPNPFSKHPVRAFLWDLLTFDKMMTGPVTHLIYWAGLGLISLIGFAIMGGAIGLGIRDGSIAGVGIAFATLIAGVLVLVALILIWRGVSEFYLAVFQIAEDLRAIRIATEHGQAVSVSSEPVPFTEPAPDGQAVSVISEPVPFTEPAPQASGGLDL